MQANPVSGFIAFDNFWGILKQNHNRFCNLSLPQMKNSHLYYLNLNRPITVQETRSRYDNAINLQNESCEERILWFVWVDREKKLLQIFWFW